MNCDRVSDHLFECIEGRLSDSLTGELREHLAGCAACRSEAEELGEVWGLMGRIDEVEASQDMRSRFYAMLSTYESGTEPPRRSPFERLQSWWPRRPVMQAGLALATLVLGLWLGPLLRPGSGNGSEIQELRAEIRDMSHAVALSLLEHRSASERLRAVSLTARAETDEEITAALLRTIDEDSSVNVRLAALEVLSRMVEQPTVRRGLLDSFPRQDSPTMQAAMADVLTAMNGSGSRRAIEGVLQREELSDPVREYLRRALSEKGDEI